MGIFDQDPARSVSRFECKYYVQPPTVDAMRRFMAPFMKPDEFAARCEGYRYTVCSLYLDSPDLRLYRNTAEGNKNRFKLRMRRYNDGPGDPVYLEIKRRIDSVIYKQRCRVDEGLARALLEGRVPCSPDESLDEVGREFKRLAEGISALPTIRVKYIREAYESLAGDRLRITFDNRLEHSALTTEPLAVGGDQWRPTPSEGVILEIKFTSSLPPWVAGMIEAFELYRLSVPKYLMSVESAVGDGSMKVQGPHALDALMTLRRSATSI